MRNLYQRLEREFGSVSARRKPVLAPDGSRLRALQGGLTVPDVKAAPLDKTIGIHGLRDLDACAEFAAAWARSLIEDGCAASEIAVMTAAIRFIWLVPMPLRAFRCPGFRVRSRSAT